MRHLPAHGLLLLALVCTVSACTDGKRVRGRARSLAASPQVDFKSTTLQLLTLPTPEGQVTLRFTVSSVGLVGDATLHLPHGELLHMSGSNSTYVVELRGDAATLESRCPPGAYTFDVLPSGATRPDSITFLSGSPPSSAVHLLAPAFAADVAHGPLRVVWTRCPGSLSTCDLVLVDAATGREAYRATGLSGLEHEIPAWALPSGRYVITVAGASGPGVQSGSRLGVVVRT